MTSGVVVNVTPDVFVFEVLDREVLVIDKDVVPLFICKGLPNCCSFDLVTATYSDSRRDSKMECIKLSRLGSSLQVRLQHLV